MRHAVNGPHRNWFGTSCGCKDAIEFEKLVDAGYATKRKAAPWMGDDVLFSLTKTGMKIVDENKPVAKLKKMTRGKRNYQAYLASEVNESFIWFLRNCTYDSYRKSF